ncbi:MAG TPA: DUF885 family protein, partial [Acidobacteriota bacterium]|nr:DUF885 family protein [Acidobacteriota bacterium]
MSQARILGCLACLAVLLWAGACSPGQPASGEQPAASSTEYQDLVDLFRDWREFQKPEMVGGVPDYTSQAMAEQQRQLADYRARLEAIDPASWTVPQQVDYKLVEAEMNGMDFDHRVRRPWERNPAFYTLFHASRSDVPAHEGPVAYPPIEVWMYDYPLSDEEAAQLEGRFRSIPALLEQARGNLTGDGRDLWMGGIRTMAGQSRGMQAYAQRVADHPQLAEAVQAASQAVDDFTSWLQEQLPHKRGPSGVGKDNYTWYLQKVHLVPYTWQEEVTLMRRALARSHASLRLEEHRNRNLPPIKVISSAQEYDRRSNRSVDRYMTFLREQEIITIRDDMDPALRARLGSFQPEEERGFFSHVIHRSPLAFRPHMHHWIELAKMDNDPHPNPVRRQPLLYNIFDGRSEGLATGVEEWFMHAGLLEGDPRSREMVWIMMAQRAARAIAGLHLHSNDWSIDEACEFASKWTPRGFMPADSDTCLFEQHLY